MIAAAGLAVYLGPPGRKPAPVPKKVSVPMPPPDIPMDMPRDVKVVAVIIDDLGHNPQAARPFLEMSYPVALSLLPDRPFSKAIAEEVVASGKTLLLHQPMEPAGYPDTDPGPGAILIDQDPEQIRQILERNVGSIPGVVGINNHMGSRATTDPVIMEAVLGFVRERGFFFIDSRTTADTIGFTMAREKGLKTAERDVFLDNDPDPAAIDRRVRELLDLADRRGWAIGIGHASTQTAAALERMARTAREREILWISLESLITCYADPGN
ncbi:MAG: divergent polysaccharide deacetylase family protein [bacterium]|nr:divergent polysaccharide deacetylase family protein [bacterium]